jgi:DNA polymerase III subunit delta
MSAADGPDFSRAVMPKLKLGPTYDVSILRPDALREQIADTATDPVYLIVGDDDHEKSALALALGEMIEDGLRAFNVERLYASDRNVTPSSVVEAARTLPMLAPRRVIIVLHAEALVAPRRNRATEPSDEDEDSSSEPVAPLLDYLAAPVPSTTLTFVFSAPEPGQPPDSIPLAKNLKITKALLKAATLVVCSGLDGGKDPARWVQEQVRSARLEIDGQALRRLLQLSGDDVGRLRADVAKLLLFAAGQPRITLDHVSAVVGAPVYHGDDWALVRAIERGDAGAALRELAAALDHGGVPFQILGQLGYAIRTPPPRGRFPARRVPAAVDALFRTDIAMKSSGGDPKVLLERLIVELCR